MEITTVTHSSIFGTIITTAVVVTTGWQDANLGMRHYGVRPITEEECPTEDYIWKTLLEGRVYTELDMESFEQGFRIERTFQIR